jgi:hypothetical protein
LQYELLGGGQRLDLRQQPCVRGWLNLHPAHLRGIERGKLLRDHRGRVWRDARMRRDLHQAGLGV